MNRVTKNQEICLARQEDWSLNQTGNWAGYDVAENGAPFLTQTRTNNKANEITGLSEPESQTQWAEPEYDARGNPHFPH